ncbi:MAG: glycoside hydrolase domain-containing protein [Bryobacteraceae bacterium]
MRYVFLLTTFVYIVRAQAPIIWTETGMKRVGRTDAERKSGTAELFAARGEYEPFQVAVQAVAGGLHNVTFRIGDLNGPNHHVISRSNLTVYREHYVRVEHGSPVPKNMRRPPLGPGWYADALIPETPRAESARLRAFPFDLDAASNQPIWVDIFIPRDAAPGTYTGDFEVKSSEGSARGQVKLTVWNFELPLKASLASSFMLWHDQSAAACELILRHKLTPTPVPIEDAERFADEFGVEWFNTGFSSGANWDTAKMGPAPSVEAIQAKARHFPPGAKLYNYTADEIVRFPQLYPQIREWAKNLHAAGVLNLITMAPVSELFNDGSGRSVVDIWVLQPEYYENSPANVRSVQSKGDRVWSYLALVQDTHSPWWEMDFPPVNYRVMQGFINQSLGFTGLLYWAVDHWTNKPWEDVDTYTQPKENGHYPGEGMLVYPGDAAGVQGTIPSIRLKWIREGVEDYEYVELLKRKGRGDWALSLVRQVATDFQNWMDDPAVIERVRRTMGEALSRH